MSDGAISIKLAPDYEMGAVQQQVEPHPNTDDLIINEAFFPDLSLSQCRNQMRIDGTVTKTRLLDALIEAIASVNDELAAFQQENSQHGKLAQIPTQHINNESILVQRYRRAVLCLAAANLNERYAAYDTTNDGEKKMELLKDGIDQLRRDARFAISDILKIRRIDVELI
ncbi:MULTISPECIES: head completion/stabilization protein [Rodentibacter]|uniref:head completion/stabilization protein n=1 Tax=Rodentibacter TaxID=1960084 RepID=UPI001CFE891E|nr:head completion/stabilization protein [Rodentibacter sp. JRC1]GJI55914.1 phage head completion/stabilization protein [Rodentibacter sp. JRC1]